MVIFTDLSEVLIKGMYGVEEVLTERFDPKVGIWFLERRVNDRVNSLFCELMRGGVREDEYWRYFIRNNPYGLSISDLKSALSENFRRIVPGTLEVYQRIIAFPRSFRDKSEIMCGSPEIFLVSDHISERIGEIKEYHPKVFSKMSRTFWSCQRGKLKSDRGFFQELLRETKLSPYEVVFIDDLQVNLLAAARANLSCLCFYNAIALEDAMRYRKFEFSSRPA